MIDVNLNGTFYMSRAFGRRMVEQGEGGSIVNISSIAGKLMAARTAAYSASKAGIHALDVRDGAGGRAGPACGSTSICPGDHRHLPHGRHPAG